MNPRWIFPLITAAWLAAVTLGADAADIRQETVQFAKGSTQATIQARIKGDADVDYLVRAKAGQQMTVTLKTNNPMNYFNVLPPGADEALFVGQDGSGHFEGVLPKDGEYAIRVYLMRAAAQRNESAQYTLTVKVTGSATDDKTEATAGGSFDETLSLQGIAFHVTSPNIASGNTVRITPTGLAIDNSPIEQEIDGVVTGAQVADINVDRSPEIYVYVTAPGPEKRRSLVAYSANKKKSLSAIYLPELTEHPNAAKGYQGHDDLAVVEGVFMRRFPIYGKGGDPAAPTGKTRQLQYKLKPGEAGWVLKLDRMMEY